MNITNQEVDVEKFISPPSGLSIYVFLADKLRHHSARSVHNEHVISNGKACAIFALSFRFPKRLQHSVLEDMVRLRFIERKNKRTIRIFD